VLGESVRQVWLLPGLDGTGALFAPLRAALGDVDARVFALVGTEYDALLDELGTPPDGTVVVAESFSGPLAVRLAARHASVAALVLVATFVTRPPLTRLAAPLVRIVPLRPPRSLVRAGMLAGASLPIVERATDVVARISPSIAAARLRSIARVDVRAELAALRIPIFWIRARHDRLVGQRATTEAIRAQPALRVHELDGPHLLAQAAPEPVAALVRRALEERPD
jgi:pimeloyl-ACP methyl ester carboxylesterase